MSMWLTKMAEVVARVATALLSALGLAYGAIAGVNLAVLPAAFVASQARGSELAALCAAAFGLLAFTVAALQLVAFARRERFRWVRFVDLIVLVAGVAGVIVFEEKVRDCVLGTTVMGACNVLFAVALVAETLAAFVFGRAETERAQATRNDAGHFKVEVKAEGASVDGEQFADDNAEGSDAEQAQDKRSDSMVASPHGHRARARRLRVAHARTVQRTRR